MVTDARRRVMSALHASDGQLPPTACAELLTSLVSAGSPTALLKAASDSLRTLPAVQWVDVGPHRRRGGRAVELHTGAGAIVLTVGLYDARDFELRQRVDALLALVAQLYAREVEVEQLRGQAHHDPLTGLWNRRGFEPFIEQALARSARSGEEIAFALIDVDHFKQVNDSFGHTVGDEALKLVADAIRSIIRPTDAAARIGGDELAMVLANCSSHGATSVAQRLQLAVRQLCQARHMPCKITMSIGIADARCLAAEHVVQRRISSLVAAADEALYRAKAHGRDRFECNPGGYEPELMDGDDDTTVPLQLVG